ncbi:hypothetical protein [Nostocoides jenkinsii]|uniref:Uncharacterized protein n=1 Tax=Nostocoides jenkinsii Ben 74 TaxID=1193518 RepID=A0A077MC03_9MICO|nr:hypothetical protein [Tetrasphaera jenkinsii]CCI53380.1 hypothetical protein BN13_380031 [Tetrasphaera jenkinsii Ben 74]
MRVQFTASRAEFRRAMTALSRVAGDQPATARIKVSGGRGTIAIWINEPGGTRMTQVAFAIKDGVDGASSVNFRALDNATIASGYKSVTIAPNGDTGYLGIAYDGIEGRWVETLIEGGEVVDHGRIVGIRVDSVSFFDALAAVETARARLSKKDKHALSWLAGVGVGWSAHGMIHLTATDRRQLATVDLAATMDLRHDRAFADGIYLPAAVVDAFLRLPKRLWPSTVQIAFDPMGKPTLVVGDNIFELAINNPREGGMPIDQVKRIAVNPRHENAIHYETSFDTETVREAIARSGRTRSGSGLWWWVGDHGELAVYAEHGDTSADATLIHGRHGVGGMMVRLDQTNVVKALTRNASGPNSAVLSRRRQAQPNSGIPTPVKFFGYTASGQLVTTVIQPTRVEAAEHAAMMDRGRR